MAVLVVSPVRPFLTSCAVAHQAPLPMGFSKQEYWSGLPTLGDLADPGIEPTFPVALHWQASSLPLCHLGSPCG